MIYLDNSATTFPKPQKVLDAMNYAVTNFTSPFRGVYPSSIACGKAITETRQLVADLFNLKSPLSVAFTQNATESLNLVINSLFSGDEHIICTSFDHNSSIRPINLKFKNYTVIECDSSANFHYEDFESAITPHTKAIILSHSSNVTGDVINIDYIGKLCKKHNLIFILDASQTAGFIEIDMYKSQIDILCFTGHKSLYSIQGVGGICVKETFNHPFKNVKVGGTGNHTFNLEQDTTMPQCFEAGTLNFPSILSLKAGIEYINSIGFKALQSHQSELIRTLYESIAKMKNITIYGNFNSSLRSPVLSFNFKNIDSGDIAQALYDKSNICLRSGFHCAPFIHQQLGTTEQGVVRCSTSYTNTMEEISTLIDTLAEISNYSLDNNL